jgi:hypothetical protein
MPITTVAAKRLIVPKAKPRPAEPNAVNSNPVITAATTPIRATSREPTKAAAANMTIGAPLRAPISVPVRLNSLRSAGITGGTARIARRRATPISQSKAKEIGSGRDEVTVFSR